MRGPRVAFFTDSFHEVNGVARTSREFEGYARRQGLPFFSLHPGPETRRWREGELDTLELKNSRFSFGLESELAFDPLFLRHRTRVLLALREFAPDLIHITGPGHSGMLGAILAHQMQIPLVASWHTNIHEFAARRVRKVMRFLPWYFTDLFCDWTERRMLDGLLWLYRFARIQFAPNPELISLLEHATKRPCYLMRRGIDTELFSPRRRDRSSDEFVIGYVGRLSPEKDVRQLVRLERKLIHAGIRNYRFLIVGDGGERTYLAEHLQRFELTGTLLGEELARAYANMDVFVFPSETDTFGNVVVEALSSGVPTVVSNAGGPQYIIDDRVNGFRTGNIDERTNVVMELYRNPALLHRMSEQAREKAFTFSWSAVFDNVYSHYDEALRPSASAIPAVTGRLARA